MLAKKVVVGLVLAVVFSLLNGCVLFAPKPMREANDMIQTGVSNFAATRSGDYNFDLDINLLGRDGNDKAQNATIHLVASGDSASKDERVSFNTKLFADAILNGDAYKLDGELRGNDSTLFAFLKTLSGPEELFNKEMVSQFTNRWWKIPLPDTAKTPHQVKKYTAEDFQAFFQILSKYLTGLAYDGADGSPGVDSYRYVAQLDNLKMKELLVGFTQSQGRSLTAEESGQLDEFLENFRGEVTLWVSMSGEILNRIRFDFVMGRIESSDGKSLGKGSAQLNLSVSNFGKQVIVEEPTEALEYDFFGKFGELFGLGSLSP